MIEKVNPKHPDKVADRIAGAIVDLAYKNNDNPKIAVEVLIGHGKGLIIIEKDCELDRSDIHAIVERIAGKLNVELLIVEQDKHLNDNQQGKVRCGDNGIFKGVPVSSEELALSKIARTIYEKYDSDGKYILDGDKLIICQSKADEIVVDGIENVIVNPLGYWTGGLDVDSGATNRKLGSDMGRAVTGGGICGKDLSKADVSVNIYAFLKAQQTGEVVEISCAIGDEMVDGRPYQEIIDIARDYINQLGGFEKFAEWGLF